MAARGMDQLILDMKIQNDTNQAYNKKLRILNEDLEKINRKKLVKEGEISRMAGVLQTNAEALRQTRTAIQNLLLEGIDIRSLMDSKILMDLHKLGFTGFRVSIACSLELEKIDQMENLYKIGVPFTYWRTEYENLSKDHLQAELNAHQSHVIFMRGDQQLAPHREVFSQAVTGLLAESRKREEQQQNRRKRKSVEEKFEAFDHWRTRK